MDIGKNFKDGWEIFKKYPVEAILGLLLAMVVGGLSLGLLVPVVYVGYDLMLLNAKRGKKISVNDIFSPLKRFWGLWGLSLMIFLICFILLITITK